MIKKAPENLEKKTADLEKEAKKLKAQIILDQKRIQALELKLRSSLRENRRLESTISTLNQNLKILEQKNQRLKRTVDRYESL